MITLVSRPKQHLPKDMQRSVLVQILVAWAAQGSKDLFLKNCSVHTKKLLKIKVRKMYIFVSKFK
jgi:hypothetical protein